MNSCILSRYLIDAKKEHQCFQGNFLIHGGIPLNPLHELLGTVAISLTRKIQEYQRIIFEYPLQTLSYQPKYSHNPNLCYKSFPHLLPFCPLHVIVKLLLPTTHHSTQCIHYLLYSTKMAPPMPLLPQYNTTIPSRKNLTSVGQFTEESNDFHQSTEERHRKKMPIIAVIVAPVLVVASWLAWTL